MFQSHDSSRHQFENSCPELDFLVDTARSIPSVLGARLSGGGFGGSIIALIDAADADTTASTLSQAYGKQYGKPCDTRIVHAANGARLIST